MFYSSAKRTCFRVIFVWIFQMFSIEKKMRIFSDAALSRRLGHHVDVDVSYAG